MEPGDGVHAGTAHDELVCYGDISGGPVVFGDRYAVKICGNVFDAVVIVDGNFLVCYFVKEGLEERPDLGVDVQSFLPRKKTKYSGVAERGDYVKKVLSVYPGWRSFVTRVSAFR